MATKPKSRKDSRLAASRAGPWHWLTRLAFGLSLALVIARLLMLETLRNPVDAVPGAPATPLGPGAATGLIVDLLCLWPALLVLLRRLLDGDFRLRPSAGAWLMVLLGAWAIASTLWAADRFTALVSSIHFFCAMVFLWSSAQLVSSWLRLRFAAGVCLGLLMVLTVTGYYYRLVEWRDLKAAWVGSRNEILHEHNWQPGSFEANQFEKRILSGAVMGFDASPNSYAALLVLAGLVTAGIIIQRWRDGDAPAWLIIPGIALLAAVPDLIWAASRGAGVTAVLGTMLLVIIYFKRESLARNSRRVYWLTLCGLIVAAAMVIGHGLFHGSLGQSSLTFRWRYWVGSARIVFHHPLLGVGWENFGSAYMIYRLPIASEEIRDPHNFIVRIVSESGAIGGLLLIAGLLRLAWEATQRPLLGADAVLTEESARTQRQLATWRLVGVVTAAMAINFFASLDLNAGSGFLLIETMRRCLFWLLLVLGIAAAALQVPPPFERRLRGEELEYFSAYQAAPWVAIAVAVGLAMFLIHNLIDFALFEFGPMFFFAMLAGAAVGIRSQGESPRRRSIVGPALALLTGVVIWSTIAVFVAAPIATAEGLAHDADDAIRGNRMDLAADDLQTAFDRVPYNGDYAARAAMARGFLGQHDAARQLLNAAINANPASVQALNMRAELELGAGEPTAAEHDLAKAVSLDPNNVALRLRLAAVLARLGDEAGARRQLQIARERNAALELHDPKRLPPDQLPSTVPAR